MNREQILSLIRTLLQIGGTLLVSQGAVSSGQWETLTTGIVTIAGGLMVVGPILWSMYAHTKSAQIAAVAAMPETSVMGQAIMIEDPALAQVARQAATPYTAGGR